MSVDVTDEKGKYKWGGQEEPGWCLNSSFHGRGDRLVKALPQGIVNKVVSPQKKKHLKEVCQGSAQHWSMSSAFQTLSLPLSPH